MQTSLFIFISATILIAQRVEFQPFNAFRSGLAPISTEANQQAQNTNYAQIPVRNSSSDQNVLLKLQNKLRHLEARNERLRGLDSCMELAWTTSITSLKLSRATVDLETCKNDFKSLKDTGRIKSSESLYSLNQLQSFGDSSKQSLDTCKDELIALQQKRYEAEDKFKTFNLTGLNEAITLNDSMRRKIQLYFRYQLVFQTQIAQVMALAYDQSNLIYDLNYQIDKANSINNRNNLGLVSCQDTMTTTNNCQIDLASAKDDNRVLRNRLDIVNIVNDNTKDVIFDLNNRLMSLGGRPIRNRFK